MIAFSHLIFALIYHSCAEQMLEKVIRYFLSLKNDCCRKHEFNSLASAGHKRDSNIGDWRRKWEGNKHILVSFKPGIITALPLH